MKRLLFVANVDWFFISHRLPIALAAQREGYEVHVAAGLTDGGELLRAHGLTVHPLSMERGSLGLLDGWRNVREMAGAIRRVRPHVVHLITIKPVVLGGIAARLQGVPAVVAAVPGMGYLFMASGWRVAVARTLVRLAYRWAFGMRNLRVIFQNPEDRRRLSAWTRLRDAQSELIRGSGVDLAHYTVQPLPFGTPRVVLAARLLHDKGVAEFVAAASVLHGRGVDAVFQVAGDRDPANRASLSEAQLERWKAQGVVEFLGLRRDIAVLFAQAHVVALPSYHEGLPRVLLEAAACGRAVVTTDVPGCRDAIEPGVTGVLVPARDTVALADAIERLLRDRPRCEAMGTAGRVLAERAFSIEQVVDRHLAIYRELLATA